MKKNTKKILYVVFILIMIGSAIIFYVESTKSSETPEIYDSTPSEIDVSDDEKETKVIEKINIKMAPDVDLAKERKKNNNNDIIGRLEIPNLFNVLVVQGSNDKFYLSHAVNKNYDIRGSEFLDSRVKVTSQQLNIYGHNSRDKNIKVPFLKLEKYLDKSFFNKNPYIIFQYDGGKNIYKIIAIKQVKDTNTEHMKVDVKKSEFVSHVKAMTSGNGLINSRKVEYDENSKIIVLQTCSHDWSNSFYIITAVKIDY